MLKVRVMSDLHINHSKGYTLQPLPTDSDSILVIAGDLCELLRYQDLAQKFFEQVCEMFREVLYVLGNHCYWYSTIKDATAFAKKFQREFPNLTVLDNKVHWIEDVMFFGGTLWTNIDNGNPIAELEVHQCMNDFPLIGDFSINDWELEHQATIFLMKKAFRMEQAMHARKKFVITHHGPLPICVDDNYDDPRYFNINQAYFSDLTELILDIEPDIWVSGHSHGYMDKTELGCRFLRNPRGYQKFDNDEHITEYTGFRPKLLIEV